MNLQRLTPWLVLVPLTFVTAVFGQTSPMSDSQKIEYLMQQVRSAKGNNCRGLPALGAAGPARLGSSSPLLSLAKKATGVIKGN
jgi:hypothetical protein